MIHLEMKSSLPPAKADIVWVNSPGVLQHNVNRLPRYYIHSKQFHFETRREKTSEKNMTEPELWKYLQEWKLITNYHPNPVQSAMQKEYQQKD